MMPFSFNTVEFYVVTINEKPWTRAREVYRALQYGKSTKANISTFAVKKIMLISGN